MEYTIYKITINDYIYVGSTKKYIQRKNEHNRRCNNPNGEKYNLFVYRTIRENGGWNNAIMSPVEIFECNTIIEAHIKEEEWRVKLNANMNTIKCFVAEKETEYKKKWYIDNLDKIKEKQKIIHTCECGDEGLLINLARHKKTKKHLDFFAVVEKKIVESIPCECGDSYTKSNQRNHTKTPQHIQYIADKLKERQTKIYTCECSNDEILLTNISRHNKTKKHLDFVAGIERKVVDSIPCACGSRYTKPNKEQHNKTKIHLEYLSNINI